MSACSSAQVSRSGPPRSKRPVGRLLGGDGLGEERGHVVHPDRLQAVPAEDRGYRRIADQPDLLREKAAVAPEGEARAKDDVLEPRVLDRLLLLPLGVVVGSDAAALLGAQRAHEHETLRSGTLRRLDQVARPLHHDVLVRAPGRAGDEVHDGLRAFDGAPQALGVRKVPLDDLTSPGSQLVLALRLAGQNPNGMLRRPQGVDDLTADEAGSPGDQNHSVSKFFQ